jgi:hypothetical protein
MTRFFKYSGIENSSVFALSKSGKLYYSDPQHKADAQQGCTWQEMEEIPPLSMLVVWGHLAYPEKSWINRVLGMIIITIRAPFKWCTKNSEKLLCYLLGTVLLLLIIGATIITCNNIGRPPTNMPSEITLRSNGHTVGVYVPKGAKNE